MPVGDEDAVPLETVVTSRFRCDGAVDGAFEVEYLQSITVPYLGFCRNRRPAGGRGGPGGRDAAPIAKKVFEALG